MKGVKCGGRVWLKGKLAHKLCWSELSVFSLERFLFLVCSFGLFFQRLLLLSVLATAVAAAI